MQVKAILFLIELLVIVLCTFTNNLSKWKMLFRELQPIFVTWLFFLSYIHTETHTHIWFLFKSIFFSLLRILYLLIIFIVFHQLLNNSSLPYFLNFVTFYFLLLYSKSSWATQIFLNVLSTIGELLTYKRLNFLSFFQQLTVANSLTALSGTTVSLLDPGLEQAWLKFLHFVSISEICMCICPAVFRRLYLIVVICLLYFLYIFQILFQGGSWALE